MNEEELKEYIDEKFNVMASRILISAYGIIAVVAFIICYILLVLAYILFVI